MIRSATRSLLVFATAVVFPMVATAQGAQPATAPAKPVVTARPTAAPTAKPVSAMRATTAPKAAAAAPAAAMSATPAARPATAPAVAMTAAPAAKPAVAMTAAPAAKPAVAAAGPTRDARGRFIAKSAAPAAGAHATCKDGTAWSGAQRSGACARHGGVKSWS